ncbi:MAG TPA: alpha/beta fold hydrolase [Rhizomicrobium sp.]
MKLVLLHSPLVGSGTWQAVASLLRARGHDAVVPDLAPVMRDGLPYYPSLANVAADAVGASSDKAILVVHSAAGALVPAIAQRVPLAGAIFVDALLPHPGRSWFETAPEALNVHLRGLARDGRLPPWDRWWPKGAIQTLLPDFVQYEQFVAELAELPLAYFEETAPAMPLTTPSVYLQLSDGYKEDADKAEAAGWPVTRFRSHHLAMLTHPDVVADEIDRLAVTLGLSA